MNKVWPDFPGPTWLEYAALTIGYVTLVVVALVTLFIFVNLFAEVLKGWFVKPALKDIPDFIFECEDHWNHGNHTATISFAQMRAEKTQHPCTALRDVEPRPASRSGGDEGETA